MSVETRSKPIAVSWTEAERSAALHGYGILDTPREQDFDDLARIASEVCGTPIAVVNLVDSTRQFFKAEVGLGVSETPLETSFCVHALLSDDVTVVPDARDDPRFASNSLVTDEGGIRFYAGALLRTAAGLPIGTMCVLDTVPRTLDQHQIRTLQLLARQVMTQLELRRTLREREEALRQSEMYETRHRQIVDSATDFAIITIDLGGRVSSWNIGAENILGWTEAEMCGQPADVFFTKEDAAALIPDKEMEAARTVGRGADERWHVRKDGGIFWASGEMMPLMDDDGAHVGYLKILRDRTASKMAEERLAKSEERLNLALGASSLIGIWDWDLLADIVYADANFARVYNVDPSLASRGAPLADYLKNFHPDDLDDFRAELGRTLDAADEFSCEYRIVQPDGSIRWLLARGRVVLDDDGTPVRFPGASIDITDRKIAEQQRIVLTREMSHRIKNILAMVQAIATQTFRMVSSVEEGRTAFTGRLTALARAQDILTQKSWETADIRAVVEGALEPHRSGEDRYRIEGPAYTLTAQQGLGLSLAMHELATNAAKYGALSNDTGKVTIDWSVQPSGAFAFNWIETGGPTVAVPERRGFGSRLVERIVATYFDGAAQLAFPPEGVTFHLQGKLPVPTQPDVPSSNERSSPGNQSGPSALCEQG
ncbi:PAS domain S-box protein [Aureimonas glaciei]|uniref:Blue-light-activated histidine kinase n=1 Tax=Aureimonas glaciei TaxID=1776957 RepID=A0A916XU42_9HYPH|nr:PAS domain S-box protein [Aureimonas glaciei]GGD10019.1 hypothetical protein GCM10011335_11160 [Aureimonas glaciei]